MQLSFTHLRTELLPFGELRTGVRNEILSMLSKSYGRGCQMSSTLVPKGNDKMKFEHMIKELEEIF